MTSALASRHSIYNLQRKPQASTTCISLLSQFQQSSLYNYTYSFLYLYISSFRVLKMAKNVGILAMEIYFPPTCIQQVSIHTYTHTHTTIFIFVVFLVSFDVNIYGLIDLCVFFLYCVIIYYVLIVITIFF